MGRLFWKFFLSILLAQIAASIGIGTVFWLRDQAREREASQGLDTSPPAEFMIEAAASTLKHGGREALRALVSDTRHRSIYVLDESGKELLGRSVSPELRAQAERALASNSGRQVVRRLAGADGHSYLVFLPRDSSRGIGGPLSEMRRRHGGAGDFSLLPSETGRLPRRQPPDGAGGLPSSSSAQGPGEPPPPDNGHGPGEPPSDEARGPGGPGPGPHDRPVPFERHFRAVAPIIAATLASLLFAALLAWYFSRPIRALRSAFEAASAGDLAPRFSASAKGRGDELTDLGRDFDRMTAQLRNLMDGQRRLLHDVSHELRSPLARLQAAIGLAHQRPDKAAASLERIERESVRMDKLVGELLTLSRLEASAALPLREDIAMMDMIEEIAGDARFEAEQCNRSIAIRGGAVVNVRGTPDLLWRAIENVVRNAIKHSPDGGTVDIDVRADVEWIEIQVLDRGPGVADGDLGAIFEPFFRSNAATNNVDGHGLGLAIARHVVDAHGGSIAASNRDGGGLRVTIRLPLTR